MGSEYFKMTFQGSAGCQIDRSEKRCFLFVNCASVIGMMKIEFHDKKLLCIFISAGIIRKKQLLIKHKFANIS